MAKAVAKWDATPSSEREAMSTFAKKHGIPHVTFFKYARDPKDQNFKAKMISFNNKVIPKLALLLLSSPWP